jgi:hypothetical protein
MISSRRHSSQAFFSRRRAEPSVGMVLNDGARAWPVVVVLTEASGVVVRWDWSRRQLHLAEGMGLAKTQSGLRRAEHHELSGLRGLDCAVARRRMIHAKYRVLLIQASPVTGKL